MKSKPTLVRPSSPIGHRPYDDEIPQSYCDLGKRVRLLCLETFKIHYATAKGGYTGFSYTDKKIWTAKELIDAGFLEIKWDGRSESTFSVNTAVINV